MVLYVFKIFFCTSYGVLKEINNGKKLNGSGKTEGKKMKDKKKRKEMMRGCRGYASA